MEPEFLDLLAQMAAEEIKKDYASSAMETANQLERAIANDNNSEQIFIPAYLKEQIINRASQPDIQIEQSAKQFPKRLELFIFGCKVTAAVAASLLIMITSAMTQVGKTASPELPDISSYHAEKKDIDISGDIMEQLNKGSLFVTNWLQSFSTSIMGNKKEETSQD